MRAIKGPAVFLAQFAGDAPPFNTLPAIAGWAAGLGFKGVQIPTWDRRLFDLEKAAESQTYCDEVKGTLAERGLQVTELSTHLQGQLVAVHPAYDTAFDGFAAPQVRGKPQARAAWAVEQVKLAARASRRLGVTEHATFSGALAWPYLYPWPQRPAGLVETAFDELARRWRPILDAFEEAGVNLCFEIQPGEDLHDGVTFEMFLDRVGGHKRCNLLYDPSHFVLQQLDYLEYIDLYHERIRMFHVKDAEFNPTGRQGVYGGFQPWALRAGRFRSLGDGQVNFKAIFSKLAQYDYPGWRCWSGSVASSTRRTAPAKGRSSSPTTSSASRNRRSMISPAPAPTWPPIAACSASSDRGRRTSRLGSASPTAARHGRGRARCFHRRRAPLVRPDGRAVRARRGRPVVRCPARQGVRRRSRPRTGPCVHQLRPAGGGRSNAVRRHRGRQHRHAERQSSRHRPRLSRPGHRRDL